MYTGQDRGGGRLVEKNDHIARRIAVQLVNARLCRGTVSTSGTRIVASETLRVSCNVRHRDLALVQIDLAAACTDSGKWGLFTKWRRSGSAGHFCTRVHAGCMAGYVRP